MASKKKARIKKALKPFKRMAKRLKKAW